MTIDDARDPARDAWSDFWGQEADSDGIAGGPASQAVGGQRQMERLLAFWREVLLRGKVSGAPVRMLDAACGSGVISRLAIGLAREQPDWQLELHCTDYSAPVVTSTMAALAPAMTGGTAANARQLPYRDASFDLVVSQFGIEYAGLEGFREAARLVGPGGRFEALMHHKEGAIYQECAGNQAVLEAVEHSGLLRLHERVFVLGAKVDERRAAPAALERVLVSANEARAALGADVAKAAHGAARSHTERLLADLQRLAQRRANYAPGVALDWIGAQAAALRAYRTRMDSMLDAALDQETVDAIVAIFTAAGLGSTRVGELITSEGAPPAAWTFSARMA